MPQSSEEFLTGLKDEIKEVEEELRKNRRLHLEDELGDILWDYLHLIHSLEDEERISVENVISRCEKKYGERVKAKDEPGAWTKIKEKQKKELEQSRIEQNEQK